jgi:hypothetical protein
MKHSDWFRKGVKGIQRLSQKGKLHAYMRVLLLRDKEVIKFDEQNGNTKWQDANVLENGQLMEYEVFLNKGEFHEGKIPEGYRKSRYILSLM